MPAHIPGGTGVIGTDGSVGDLRFGSSTQADIRAAAGIPEVTSAASYPAPGTPDFKAVGYQCSPNVIPGAKPLLLSTGTLTFCVTVYYLNASTGLLEAFETASPNFHTTKGTTVGQSSAQAQQLEGQPPVVTGCGEGIALSSAATVVIEISTQGSSPTSSGTVTDIRAETSKRFGPPGITPGAPGVGLLYC